MTIKMTEKCGVRREACETCPFAGRKPIELAAHRMDEIVAYLGQGQNHMCHSDRTDRTVCRGGRTVQLRLLFIRGIISSPTDEALAEAMRGMGIEPGNHISEGQG